MKHDDAKRAASGVTSHVRRAAWADGASAYAGPGGVMVVRDKHGQEAPGWGPRAEDADASDWEAVAPAKAEPMPVGPRTRRERLALEAAKAVETAEAIVTAEPKE